MKYITIGVLIILILTPSTLACKMWGMTSDTLQTEVVNNHLIDATTSLKNLAQYNDDGWGLIYYDNNPIVIRGEQSAYYDTNYDSAVNTLANSGVSVAIGHVRKASSGASSIPNPHPFVRGDWSFCHNGGLSKDSLKGLIGTALSDYTPTVGDNWDDSDVVDSDLYMVLVLESIKDNNGDILSGIRDVAKILPTGAANFLLSDGISIWGFKRGLSLHYTEESSYSAIVTEPPDNQNTWISLSDYEVIEINAGEEPVSYGDIRNYEPTSSPTETKCSICNVYKYIFCVVIGIIIILLFVFRKFIIPYIKKFIPI